MRCPNCGWDNADQNKRCEKCNAPLFFQGNESDIPSPIQVAGPIPPPKDETDRGGRTIFGKTILDPIEGPDSKPGTPSNTSPSTGGTIPPWAMFGNAMSYCKLTPLPSAPNERHLPNDLELKGEYVELKRGNLEPENYTISQKLQAVLTSRNGKWFIKDQSAFKTTYVLATEEVPLKNGDVILMGNRRFVFTEG